MASALQDTPGITHLYMPFCMPMFACSKLLSQHHGANSYHMARFGSDTCNWNYQVDDYWAKTKRLSTRAANHSTSWKHSSGGKRTVQIVFHHTGCVANAGSQMPSKNAHLQFQKWAQEYGTARSPSLVCSMLIET